MPLFNRHIMEKLAVSVFLAFLTAFAPVVLAYDLPEVIGEFCYDYPPSDYCSIGDQNYDGKDDLLIAVTRQRRCDLFFGSNRMGDSYDLSIPSFRGENSEINEVLPLGLLLPNYPLCFATFSRVFNENISAHIDFYTGLCGENDSLWGSWSSLIFNDARVWSNGQNRAPFDFNGDGWMDVFLNREVNDSIYALDIYFGGADFDSTPDWRKYFRSAIFEHSWSTSARTGCDVNGDGFDDILTRGLSLPENGDRSVFLYSLFLGGADPDTNPAVFFWNNSFPGYQRPVQMECGFSLLPDVNDDGYDDFGIYYKDSFILPEEEFVCYWDGIYLFFGGEDVDGEPDMILAGAQRGEAGAGKLVGGDFNGDGIGDIVASYTSNSPPGNEEFHYHFGSAYLDTLPDMIFSSNDLGDQYGSLWDPGAVGDYNGDGADDVAVTTSSEIRLIILAGNPDWRVGVEDQPKVIPQEFYLELSPNPFNSELTITCKLTKPGNYRLRVFDVAGREIETLFKGLHSVGSLRASWSAQQAGIYFFDLSSEDGRRVVKKAVCLP